VINDVPFQTPDGEKKLSLIVGQVSDSSMRLGDYYIVPTKAWSQCEFKILSPRYKYNLQCEVNGAENYAEGTYLYIEQNKKKELKIASEFISQELNTGLELVTTIEVPNLYMDSGIYCVLSATEYQDGEPVILW
jgi:hypothetical protein